LFPNRLRHKLTERDPALGSRGLRPAKNVIRNFQCSLHEKSLPYLRDRCQPASGGSSSPPPTTFARPLPRVAVTRQSGLLPRASAGSKDGDWRFVAKHKAGAISPNPVGGSEHFGPPIR